MHEEIKLKISQFVDAELGLEEGLNLFRHMQENPDCGEVFRRYAAISETLKSDACVVAGPDFVTRVSAQIKNEPTVLCPAIRPTRSSAKTVIALAASLMAIAVVSGGVVYYRDTHLAAGNAQMARNQSSGSVYSVAESQHPDDARFNEYLEAHGATLYTGGYPAGRVYGQVASYGRK
jgi:negative regulator of sigma E activity